MFFKSKSLALLAGLFSLTLLQACGGGGGGNGTPAQTMIIGENYTDVTDTSSCTGSPPTSSQIYGTWYNKQQSDNGFTTLLSIMVSDSQTTLTDYCSYQGLSTSVSITVPSTTSSTTLSITGSDSNQTTSGILMCKIGVSPETISFAFAGKCIQITDSSGHTAFYVKNP